MKIEIKISNKVYTAEKIGGISKTNNIVRKTENNQRVQNKFVNLCDRAIEKQYEQKNTRKAKRQKAFEMRATKRGLV